MTGIAFFQVQRAIPTTTWEMISHATTVTQAVLVLLALLSVASWAVMLAKWLEFRRVDAAARTFMSEFARTTRLDEVRMLSKRSLASPFTRMFSRAADFLDDIRAGARTVAGGMDSGGASGRGGAQVEALRLVLDSEAGLERGRLGRYIPSLAVIGSVSPLIGLLGTVLGIIDSFIGIATQGSGNIGAVAPGIAEALIATAAALAVAIPAVFGYNIFANRLNRIDGELDAFGTEVIAMMVREGQI